MRIIDDGKHNPMIVVSPDEVLAWLRQKADEAGYGDREACAVQVSFRKKEGEEGEDLFRWELPELLLMVSNIKGGRGG